MTHTFQFNGEFFAYDSESGAFHHLDEAAFLLIQACQANGSKMPDRPGDYVPKLPAEEVAVLCSEIEQLIEAGELFAEGVKISADQLYPDGVVLKAMCLIICQACNLRCRYCFAADGTYGDSEQSMMSYETGKRAVDFLIEKSAGRKNLDLDFFGGEPLLNWNVVKQLAVYAGQAGLAAGKNIRLTLTTNATSLDAEKTSFINKYFKNVVLSLDGRREVNDRMRLDAGGNGSYDMVAPKIRDFIAERAGQEYYIRGTFTVYNLDFTADALHLAEFGSNISLEPVISAPGCDYGIGLENIPAIEMEYEKLALAIDELDRRGKDINYFHFALDLSGGPCLYKRLKGCGVGLEYCAVAANGDIYPCHQLVGEREYLLGSVRNERHNLKRSVRESFYRFLLSDQEPCSSCWARYHCGGGCAADVLHVNGDLTGLNEISCRLMKKRLECALWLAYRKSTRREDKF